MASLKSQFTESINNNRTVFLLMVLLGFLAYLRLFSCGWTFDDVSVIVNKNIEQQVSRFLGWGFFSGRHLRDLTFYLDMSLFDFNARYWHIQNIAYHVFNAYLLFVLLTNFIKNRRVALFAAMIFLVHPIHVEVVAQMSHRKDSLALMFSQLSLLSFSKVFNLQGKNIKYLVLCFVFLLFAVSAKQNSIIMVAILPAYYLIFEYTKKSKKSLVVLIPFLALFFFAFYAWGFQGIEHLATKYEDAANLGLLRLNYVDGFSFYIYSLAVLKSWSFIFMKFFIPFGFAVNYAFPVPGSILDPYVFVSIVLICLYFVLFFYYYKDKVIRFGLIWLALAWLPTSNLWPFAYFAADRYFYFPSIGLLIVLAALVQRYAKANQVLGGWACLLLIVCTILTVRQTGYWRNEHVLWLRSYDVNPSSVQAIVQVGYHDHYKKGDRDGARRMFFDAIEVNPKDPMPSYYLAHTSQLEGEMESACSNYLDFVYKYEQFPDGRYKKIWRSAQKNIKALECNQEN